MGESTRSEILGLLKSKSQKARSFWLVNPKFCWSAIHFSCWNQHFSPNNRWMLKLLRFLEMPWFFFQPPRQFFLDSAIKILHPEVQGYGSPETRSDWNGTWPWFALICLADIGVSETWGALKWMVFMIPPGISSKESDNPGCQFPPDSLERFPFFSDIFWWHRAFLKKESEHRIQRGMVYNGKSYLFVDYLGRTSILGNPQIDLTRIYHDIP